MQILVAFLLATVVSYVAFRFHALSSSGALAATLVGTMVFGLGGWPWAVLLLTFFASSSALTRAFDQAKRSASEKYSKGSVRDAGQVLSNGGLAAGFALLHALFPLAAWPWLGFAATLAAVNADTWATELGVLDRRQPRLITALGKRVEAGTSGGVSLVGTLASFLGSALIGILAGLLAGFALTSILAAIACVASPLTVFGIVTIGGFIGSLVDSYLGATVQAMFYCPRDQKETEKHPLHSCGTPTVHIRGWKWLNNDLVNVMCGAAGAAVALGIASLIGALWIIC